MPFIFLNSKVDTKLIRSFSHDPWYNLALEEALLNQVQERQIILYLWQNENTVVIGRNQNAWKECRCKQLEDEGGKLARRLSGGGAVFHDLGNLNFTFIMDKKLYDLERQLVIILQAIKRLGVDAEFSGRNDLVVQGKKFSGNAFYYGTDKMYHHGTLLVNSNLTKLTRYLQVSREKIVSKGIDSVEARVVNLSKLNANITIETMIECLEESFLNHYGGTWQKAKDYNAPIDIESLYGKYASWEWRYGESPEFNICYCSRFGWGEIEIRLRVENGYIASVKVYSDAMEVDLIDSLAEVLERLPFKKEKILSAVSSIPITRGKEYFTRDLQIWLDTKLE